MKINIKSLMAFAVLALPSVAAFAQNTNSAYFTDGYLFRHEMNPAFGNEKNYISVPALGNVNFAMRGNIGLSDILYNVNGKTVTFMHPGVSAGEFLGNINDKNKLGADVKFEILSAGFKGFGGYNTIGVNVRSNLGVTLPGSILRLAKEGPANSTYDISDFNVHSDVYAELSFGHSRQINDKLRVGAALKVLLGGANIDAEFETARLTLGEDAWTAVTNAKVQASVKGLIYEMSEKERGPEGDKTIHKYVDDVDVDGTGLNGFGLAVDLGAEYKLNNDWRFSAALLDLGFISWSNNMVASTNGERTFTTDIHTFNVDDDAGNSFSREIDRMGEKLASLYELQDNGDAGGRSKMLGATLNLGAEYTLPAYRKLTFGLMNSTRIQSKYSWTEFRLSANVAPVKMLSAGVNVAAGTYGCSLGWILNFHPTGFNLYLGMDHTLGSLAKQGVPLSSNASVNFGMNFPF